MRDKSAEFNAATRALSEIPILKLPDEIFLDILVLAGYLSNDESHTGLPCKQRDNGYDRVKWQSIAPLLT